MAHLCRRYQGLYLPKRHPTHRRTRIHLWVTAELGEGVEGGVLQRSALRKPGNSKATHPLKALVEELGDHRVPVEVQQDLAG